MVTHLLLVSRMKQFMASHQRLVAISKVAQLTVECD